MFSWVAKIRSSLVVLWLRMHGAVVGQGVYFGCFPNILLRDGATLHTLTIGDNVVFDARVYIRIRSSGKLIVEDNARICAEVWLVTANSSALRVGPRTVVGPYNILNGGHGLDIGADCLLAGFVYCCSSDHVAKRGKLIREQGFAGAPIVIGDDSWIGGHVAICKGVHMANGSVVGAGAVVTSDTSPYSINAGVPAKKIGERE